MKQENNLFIKLVVMGDSQVGKTSLIQRFFKEEFLEIKQPTIGADFKGELLTINNQNVGIQLWDQGGKDLFRPSIRDYYIHSQGAILVYDLSKKNNFERFYKWIEEFRQYSDSDAVLMIMGNKKDLLENMNECQEQMREVSNFAANFKALYEEVSALQNINVNESFMKIIQEIIMVQSQKKIQNQELHE